MTIAFVLLTHRRPEPVLRIVEALVHGSRDRLVVVCHNGPIEERQRIAASRLVDKVLPSPGGRGRFGLVDAALGAMRWLEAQPKAYDWLVQLSGQDYPIRPIRELEDELARGTADGYFHHFDAFDATEAASGPMSWSQHEVENRYSFRYALLKPDSTALLRALLKAPRLLLERTQEYRLHTGYALMVGARSATPFSESFRLFGGSFWVTINRKSVRAVLHFVDERPDVVAYFRDVLNPDEAFFHTVLANRPDIILSRRELRYYDFSKGRLGHPAIITHADLDRVLASGCYFARKFDFEHDPEIATVIDRRVHGAAAEHGAGRLSVPSR
jgi:hypothetical protein